MSSNPVTAGGAFGAEVAAGGASRPAVAAAPPAVEQGAAASGTISEPPLKKSKKFSHAWLDFHQPSINEEGHLTTRCKHCPKQYRADSKDCGTTNLNKHIRKCPGHPDNKSKKQSILQFTTKSDGSTQSLGSWAFNQVESMQDLVRMIIMDELPLSFVEHEGFQRWTKGIQPLFQIPSRSTMTRDLFEMHTSERNKFKELLRVKSPRVSLTTNTWTRNQLINYMCITAHYIDDWKLHSKIISFCQINSHKGKDIGKALEQCLQECGIDRIMSITLDNAKSNDVVVQFVRRKMNLLGKSVLGGKFLHMRCCAHIINLIVKKGLTLLGNPVEKVRVSIRFFKQSPARMSRFKECVAAAGIYYKNSLVLDVSIRWNSTYLMLQSAVALEAAFDRYDSENALLRHELESKFKKGTTEPLGMFVEED